MQGLKIYSKVAVAQGKLVPQMLGMIKIDNIAIKSYINMCVFASVWVYLPSSIVVLLNEIEFQVPIHILVFRNSGWSS